MIRVKKSIKSKLLYENGFLNFELLCAKLSVGYVNAIGMLHPSGSSMTYEEYINALSKIGDRCMPNDKLFEIVDFNMKNLK